MTRLGMTTWLVAALALAGLAGAAGATEQARFTVSLGGLRAGTIVVEGSESGGRYELRGAARAGGLAQLATDAAFDSVARGQVTGNRYRPEIARERITEGGEIRERVFRYAAGVPEVSRTPPEDEPDPHAVPAGRQQGTIDPSTAAFAILRDRPADLACTLDLAVFDGTRRHRIRLDRRTPTEDGLVCEGTYTRVAGFKPETLAERRDWPLRMEYRKAPKGAYEVHELSFPTSYGTVRVLRR